MEELKPFSELTEPDIRQRFFAVREHGSLEGRPLRLEDIYRNAESVSLHSGVPDDVRSHFATAQNLLAYSWFYYPFNVTAELHGYISVEFALKRRYPNKARASFRDLLNCAVSDGLLTANGFSYGRNPASALFSTESTPPIDAPEVQDYVTAVVDAMRSLRNSLAHGTPMLHMKGGTALLVCSELINQLFPRP